MTSEEVKAQFLKVIKEERLDSGPTRKIFSDWLEDVGLDDEAQIQRDWTTENHIAAEQVMRDFIEAAEGYSYETISGETKGISFVDIDELLTKATEFLDTGESFTVAAFWPDDKTLKEFWAAYVVLTGRPLNFDPDAEIPDPTICSC